MSVASFVAATAEKFGLSHRHVFRMVAAGEKLGIDSARLHGCPRPVTMKDLLEIGSVSDPTERYAIVDALREGKAKSAAAARRAWAAKEKGEEAVEKDPAEEAFNALKKAWERAPMTVRRRFWHEFSDDIAAMEGHGE